MDRISRHTPDATQSRCTQCGATREEIEDNLAPLCDARATRAMHEANQARFMGGHASAPWIPHTYRGGPGCIYCGAAQIDVEAKRVSPGCNMHAPQPLAMPETSLTPDIEAIRRIRPDLSGVIDDYLALTTVAVGEIVQVKPIADNPWAYCLVVVTDVRPWGVIGYQASMAYAPGVYPLRLTTEEFIRTGGKVATHPPGAAL